MAPSTNRIPGLDGLRAIAILLVLAGHGVGTHPLPFDRRFVALGELGVITFFVISGFLITTLLVREREVTGRISLRGFYLRRVARIFPAFYVYLAMIVAAAGAGWLVVDRADVLWGGTYLMDFHAQRTWELGHLWSLAVEEQFYLVWPLVVVACRPRTALAVAVTVAVLAPALRVGAWITWPAARPFTDRAFPFVFDALAIGCVLALARPALERSRIYLAVLESPLFWVVPAVAVLSENHDVYVDLAAKPTIVAVAAAMTIHRVAVRRPQAFATRALSWRPVAWLGGLSYSLYLWQQPFLHARQTTWYTAFPLNLGLALAAACASYYLVEQPVLRWRARRLGA